MAQIRNPNLPRLLDATPEYTAGTFNRNNDVLRQYFTQVNNALQQLLLGFNHFGVFKHTDTITNSSAGTEQLIEYDTTIQAFGVSVDAGNPSRLYVDRPGLYNFQFSAQLDHASGSDVLFYIWFKKNGTSVADSATRVHVPAGASGETFAAWNYVIALQPGDYFEMAWMSSEASAVIAAYAAASPVPAVPSVIMTVTYVFPDDVPT